LRGLYISRSPPSQRRLSMTLQLLKSKIHRATVTDANINYEGSLTIDHALMDEVGLLPYERVLCGNMSNGERFETYAIAGERGSGSIILNGATAHLGKLGDRLTIMSFAQLKKNEISGWKPKVIVLSENNTIITHR
jgi:aspartate 1-decarboxylase